MLSFLLRKKQTPTWEGKYARTAGVGRKSNHITNNDELFLILQGFGQKKRLEMAKKKRERSLN